MHLFDQHFLVVGGHRITIGLAEFDKDVCLMNAHRIVGDLGTSTLGNHALHLGKLQQRPFHRFGHLHGGGQRHARQTGCLDRDVALIELRHKLKAEAGSQHHAADKRRQCRTEHDHRMPHRTSEEGAIDRLAALHQPGVFLTHATG